MDTRVIPFVFVLSWCGTHVETAAAVPPPTNVTLRCHNMQNTLMWTYEQLSNGLKFKVLVRSTQRDPVSFLVNSTSFDLSDYSDPGNEYMVMVSAVKDGVQSEPVPEEGIEYSYFKDALVTVICKVDLPLVNVALEDKHLHFSFTHPGLLYPTSHKLRKKKNLDSRAGQPLFQYHVTIINQNVSHDYTCTESICQDKFLVHDSEEPYCLNISGEMNKISVQATKLYCSEPLKAAGISVLAYVLPVVIVLGFFLIIGVMVFLKKTRRKTNNPNVLTFARNNRAPPSPGNTEVLNPVDVVPRASEAPIPQSQDTSVSSPGVDDLRLRLGLPDNDHEPELEEVPETPGYTEGRCLEEDEDEVEEAPSPRSYESRPLVNNYESNHMQ
ncbi:growth/differentiation factor 10b [Eucyclogobius newberryi]|uniref:growth/differentiation factor 10b n=1 Tax=Eucyclogobius newberryi TaxID=166745 RepID=UPI003B5940DF